MRYFGLVLIFIGAVIIISSEYAAEQRYQKYAIEAYNSWHHNIDMIP